MTVKKGLKALAESSPNFSNQGLENAINDIKSVDKDDGYSWIKSSIDVDTAIEDNTVLTASQKNDLKDTINNQSHLNVGRYLNDVIRHTNSILDGTIVYRANPDVEIVPTFLETEDSSAPVFTSLKDTLSYLDATARTTSSLATATAAVRYSNTQLITFLASVVADSTDFQQTLDTYGSQLAGNYTNLNNQLASEPLLTKKTQLIADRDEIVTQVDLENSNLSGIRTYTKSLVNFMGYTSLAENNTLRQLMARVSQSTDWQTYFNDFEANKVNVNPMLNTGSDSDKESVIDRVLAEQGLPDVLDFINLEGVANKAKKNSRIDTANFDYLTTAEVITKCCEQLGIGTSNNSIYNQSELLLNNLNDHDRQLVADSLDLNESSNTLS